jgi:hypothetical protein
LLLEGKNKTYFPKTEPFQNGTMLPEIDWFFSILCDPSKLESGTTEVGALMQVGLHHL